VIPRFYSLNHYICPANVSLPSFLDTAVTYGFVGVGLTERALAEAPPERLREELAARGLTVTSVNSAGHFLHADPDAARRQRSQNDFLVAAAHELGDVPLNVYSGGLGQALGRMSLPEARQHASEGLQELHAAMSRVGVPMLFEPMHPMAIWQRSVFNSIADTEALIEGMSASSVNLDLFHSWWDADIDRFIAQPGDSLGLVQICDVDMSASDAIPRRVPLGEGVVEIPRLVRAVRSRPNPPLIEVELFAFQLEHRDFAQVLDSTVSYLERLHAAD
jgi:sugar phosphate isomerase/epimerase